jgi:hypothetical protein
MTENAFHFIIDQHRDKTLWKRNGKWDWELIIEDHPFYKNVNFNENSEKVSNNSLFKLTPSKKSTDSEDEYILVGKGV